GGGNTDSSNEIFYLLSPIATAQSAETLSFNTGASNMAVATATPLPSPAPSPTPTPSPAPGVPAGLAPGQLSIVRAPVNLAPSSTSAGAFSETTRSPALPIELNGVSVAVNGAAAGLYFAGTGTALQINYVMPIGLSTGLGNVVVNVLNSGSNSDTILHGQVQVVSGQPDIFSSTMDAGGTAIAFNVTNPGARSPQPFNVTSPDAGGTTVPTVIELSVTGVRSALTTEISITIGTTTLAADAVTFVGPNPEMPGLDLINFKLPDTLAGAGDVPIVVTFTRGGVAVTSRPVATAPHIVIN
ncbi:MAG TPA: hypothetical protein VKB46_13840, partial [Pyrinomonadaceae bacterium]|nr:hypothetical protein [Pyrinomonadaceae bacterium]